MNKLLRGYLRLEAKSPELAVEFVEALGPQQLSELLEAHKAEWEERQIAKIAA